MQFLINHQILLLTGGSFLMSLLVLICILLQGKNNRKNQLLDNGLQQFNAKLHAQQKELLQLFNQAHKEVLASLTDNTLKQSQNSHTFSQTLQKELQQQQTQLEQRHPEILKGLQESVQKNMIDVRAQLTTALTQHSERIEKQLQALTQTTSDNLKEISGQVDKRLSEGFAKTTATFTDIIKRLALIDQAQQKITELSTNVVNLQQILADKRARGAFGEVQLSNLLANVLPQNNYALQHTLSNGKRVDCLLFLPQPTGNLAIDAKFPLESFQILTNHQLSDNERQQAQQQFRKDIRKHIQDIAEKYIITNETSEGAVMFIPAEAVFAEIHAHYPELVSLAQQKHVWLASPTTMMAILTTARAALKDADTRKQVHIIQEHLSYLAKDFTRFQQRMDNLAKHISQAHEDVNSVNTSAKKISSRFDKIERVELNDSAKAKLEMLEEE